MGPSDESNGDADRTVPRGGAGSADAVVRAEGAIDLATARALLERLVSVQAAEVTLDLGGVTFIDAHGIGRLVEATLRILERGSRLRIVGATEAVARTFRLADVGSLLEDHLYS